MRRAKRNNINTRKRPEMTNNTPAHKSLPIVAWVDDRECDYRTSVTHLDELYDQLALFSKPRNLSRNQLMALTMTMLSAIVQGTEAGANNKSEMDLERFELFARQVYARTRADIDSGYIDVVNLDYLDEFTDHEEGFVSIASVKISVGK